MKAFDVVSTLSVNLIREDGTIAPLTDEPSVERWGPLSAGTITDFVIIQERNEGRENAETLQDVAREVEVSIVQATDGKEAYIREYLRQHALGIEDVEVVVCHDYVDQKFIMTTWLRPKKQGDA